MDSNESYSNIEVGQNSPIKVGHNFNLIPKTIYLCYKNKNIPPNIIPTWSNLNPSYEISLYDDDLCKKFLYEEYGSEFVDIFSYIEDGPIKADFWRVCILYKYGGTYADIDIEPFVGIDSFLEDHVSFLTCISKDKLNYNPHIIISKSNHPILRACIDVYVEKYRKRDFYYYWNWSIVWIMSPIIRNIFGYWTALDGTYTDSLNNTYQFIREIETGDWKKIYCVYKDTRILNNRYLNYNLDLHQFT